MRRRQANCANPPKSSSLAELARFENPSDHFANAACKIAKVPRQIRVRFLQR